jgi:putative ABC transport system permease protein
MIQSMVRMMHVDPGFRTSHILMADLNLPSSRYATPESRALFTQKLLDTMHDNARFKSVALSDSPALSHNLKMMMFEPGTLGDGDKTSSLQERTVGPGFFETLNIPLRAGRTFNEKDVKGATNVAIVNEAMMRQYFAGNPPIGKILKFGDEPNDQAQIVGVVADTRDVHLRAAPRPQVYLPMLQHSDSGIYLFVRTSADPLALAPELEKLVWSIDKDQPVSDVQSLTQVIADSVSEPRFRTWVLGIFAFAGLILTLVGIYGVISYMAGQRTREIGIRVALGAQRSNVLGLVLGQGIRLAIMGAIAGVVGSVALTRLLKSELFDIKPTDPATLIGTAVLMLLVALAACYLPARRATHVDPLVALRHE